MNIPDKTEITRKAVHCEPIAPRREKCRKRHGQARTHPPRPVRHPSSGPARSKQGLPSRSDQFRIRDFENSDESAGLYKGNPCYKLLFEILVCVWDHFGEAGSVCDLLSARKFYIFFVMVSSYGSVVMPSVQKLSLPDLWYTNRRSRDVFHQKC